MKTEVNCLSLRSTLPRAYLHHLNTVVEVSVKGNVRVLLDRVAAVAESQTTTEGNIHEATMVGTVKIEATTIVANKTSAQAIQEVKARVRQPAAAVAAAIVLLRKRAGHRFLNVPINWNNSISETIIRKAESIYSSPFLFL